LTAASAGGGFAAGAIHSGSLKGGVNGAFSGLMLYGIGSGFQGAANANLAAGPPASQLTSAGLTAAQTASKIISHGLAGGVMDSLAGGKFGHGFASAGFVEAAGPLIGGAKTATGQVVAAAIAGGTASAMTGGKFANGAMTAAFSRAFNEIAHYVRTADGEMTVRSPGENFEFGIDDGLAIAGFVPGVDLAVCYFAGCTPTGWTLAGVGIAPGGGKLASFGAKGVVWGLNRNQFRHTFRHLYDAGFSQNDVMNIKGAILRNVEITCSALGPGSNNRSIVYDGVELNFNAYVHPEGVVTVQRITPPRGYQR
jgi:hypothetical protein